MTIDFAQIRERLTDAQSVIHGETSPADVERVLRERARRTATRDAEAHHEEVAHEVVVVRSGGALWGLPVDALQEVRRVRVCCLPGLRGALLGLFQVRGEAIALVDLRGLEGGSAEAAHDEMVLAAVVAGRSARVGLRIDEVVGRQTVHTGEIATARSGASLDFVADVTRDLVSIVSVDHLLARPEIAATGAR